MKHCRPPILKSLDNKENINIENNRQIITTQSKNKIRTPSRGRQITLLKLQQQPDSDNNIHQENRQHFSISNYKTIKLPQNLSMKRQGNLSAKNQKELDNFHKLFPPTCDERKYQIGPIIGKGSYAIVKMGQDHQNTKVAIKMYEKATLSGERLNNVLKEISTLKTLNHDQVVKFYDIYHVGGYINLVLEYCGVESLYSLIKTSPNRCISKEFAFNIIQQLLKILHYVHDRNVCHRDIKLENVLIQNKKIKLIDFGFSIHCNQQITCHCGTPSYMAPEVVSKLKYDGRTADIWAVGVLFVALLQGSFPFKGQSERDLFKKIRNNESKILSLDKDVNKFLSHIFVIDPNNRATAKELLQLDVFK